MNERLAFVAIVTLLVGTIAAASVFTEGQGTTSATGPGDCSAVSGVFKAMLSSRSLGEVTTCRLPKPLRAPNSIVSAPDGSVWFGEAALRGVAHLFENVTLDDYPWPSSFYATGVNCFDLNQLWGLVLWKGMVWASDHANDQLVGLNPSKDSFQTVRLRTGYAPLFLAIDPRGDLWFTTSGTPAEIGMVDSDAGLVSYFSVPAASLSPSRLHRQRLRGATRSW